MWEMDANAYGDGGCAVVFQMAGQVRAAFSNGESNTLVTKVMLGTFGAIPAFDGYFKKGFGVSTFGPEAMRQIGEFYDANAAIIERSRVTTLGFQSGHPTKRRYTRAKVIDMTFFVAGGRRTRSSVRRRRPT